MTDTNAVDNKAEQDRLAQDLLDAIVQKNVLDVVALLKRGAPLQLGNKIALSWACQMGLYQIIKMLVDDHNADIEAGNGDALVAAAMEGHVEIVRFLLDRGAKADNNQNKALRHAAKFGHPNIIRLLLQHGADVHAMEDRPLKLAIENRHVKAVRVLNEFGATQYVVKASDFLANQY